MVEIRALTDADIDAAAVVHVRGWQRGYAGIVPAGFLDAMDPAALAQWRRTRPRRAGERSLVAVHDGTVVGFAHYGGYRVEQDEHDPAIGELYAVYVDPDRWGTGAGRALLAAARAGLAAAGFAEMRLWVLEENHRARRFYERAGLAPDGARELYVPRGTGAELPEVRYSVRLG